MKTSILKCLRPGLPLRRVTWHVVLQPAPPKRSSLRFPPSSPFPSGQPGHTVSDMRSSLSDAGARRRYHVLVLFSFFLEHNTLHTCVVVRFFFVPIQNLLRVSGSADYATRAVEGLLHLPPPCIRRARECCSNDSVYRSEVRGFNSNCRQPPPCFLFFF